MEGASKNNLVLTILVVSALFALYALQGAPLGFVTFDGGITNNTEFTTTPFELTCSGSTNTSLENISLILTDSGINYTNTTLVLGNTNQTNFSYSLSNGNYEYYCEICGDGECNTSEAIYFSVNVPVPISNETYQGPVINLTFDDNVNPLKDYSELNHQFSFEGSASQTDNEICKWYGCLDLRDTSGDYISSDSLFYLNKGFTVAFWTYLETSPSGSDSQAYFEFGEDANNTHQYMEEGDYGLSIRYNLESSDISQSIGAVHKTAADMWNHYVISYNNSHLRVWKNGELIQTYNTGNDQIQFKPHEPLSVGRGVFGIDVLGYMDEFLVWNRGNFSEQDITNLYDVQRKGTPSELDLVTQGISYELPYNFSSSGNPLLDQPLNITITVANLGTVYDASSVDVELFSENSSVCLKTVDLNAQTTINITCQVNFEVGKWYDGYVLVDSTDKYNENNYFGGREDNNKYIFYLPYESHPRLRFNQTDWDDTIYPIISDSNNKLPNGALSWYSSFLSDDFNPSWVADNVDPRGKKGYENALNCFLNDYGSAESCQRAKNHLDGWLLNTTDWATSDVQAVHEIFHVGATYDLMFPSFTQSEAEEYTGALADVCLEVYGKPNVVPHTDSLEPHPGNGYGFGIGMAGACFAVLGDYINNPTLAWSDPQSTVPRNTVYYWNERVERFLEGLKDDKEAFYPEGMLYNWYARYHMVDVLWFLKRTDITPSVSTHQNAICSFAKEAAYNILDHNYNGNTLRGDENSMWRQITYGDTNAYEQIGSDGLNKWDVITAYGLLCDDTNSKVIARKLRDLSYETGAQPRGPGALYYYSLLANEVPLIDDIADYLPPFSFSKAFDRFTLRRGFTYQNDTVIIFDGGDEASGGHPNAEFVLFAYAFGEPFLDFNQVPYNDDVRSEVWANTISFTQSNVSGYNTDPYNAKLHQYYGGQEITGTYPNFNYRPDGYRGDVTGTIATSDGNYATLHAYHPYKTTTSDPIRDIVIFDNLLIQVDKVHRDTTGPIYANWLNIYDEFTPTINGANLTFQRVGTNKFYEVNGMWSSTGSINLQGGDSGHKYCFQKTNCNNGKGNYGKYYHEVQGPDAVTLFAHQWYEDSPTETITLYDGTDKGVQTTNKLIILDTNEDNIIQESGYETNGYSLAIKDTIVASSGTTYIKKDGTNVYSSDQVTSTHINTPIPGQIYATINAESLTTLTFALPGATSATVEIDGTNIHSSQYTINNDEISFDINEGIHEIYINQEGDAPPSVSASAPLSNQQYYSDTSTVVSFSCLGTDDNLIDTIAIQTNKTGVMSTLQLTSPNSAGGVLDIADSFPQGVYAWKCLVTDNTSQTTTSTTKLFSVSKNPIIFPDTTRFNGRTTNFHTLPSLDNQTGIVLEDENLGFLNFTGTISTLDGVNFSESVIITDEYIEVKSEVYPQLNVPACLEFYNASYSKPRIKRNGVVYTDFTNYSYVNNTLRFCVSGFSKYEIEETPEEESAPSGGGGGGGGGGFGSPNEEEEIVEEIPQNNKEKEIQVFSDEEERVQEEVETTLPQEETPQPSQPSIESPQNIEELTSTNSWNSLQVTLVSIALFSTLFFIIRRIKKHHNEPKF